jgi:hypothetical protein
MIEAIHIKRLLEQNPVSLDGEKAVQARIAELLEACAIPFTREVRLSDKDVIDFMAGSSEPHPIGIEVKVKGDRRQMLRQMKRYAAHDQVEHLLLVTAKATGMPPKLNDKPITIVSLGAAWL